MDEGVVRMGLNEDGLRIHVVLGGIDWLGRWSSILIGIAGRVLDLVRESDTALFFEQALERDSDWLKLWDPCN